MSHTGILMSLAMQSIKDSEPFVFIDGKADAHLVQELTARMDQELAKIGPKGQGNSSDDGGRGGSEDPTGRPWSVAHEGGTHGVYFKDVGSALDFADAKQDASPGTLRWVLNTETGDFRLPFTLMTAIKSQESARYPHSEEQIAPMYDAALRLANRDVGQCGVDGLVKCLPLLLSHLSGQSLAWCDRYVRSKLGRDQGDQVD